MKIETLLSMARAAGHEPPAIPERRSIDIPDERYVGSGDFYPMTSSGEAVGPGNAHLFGAVYGAWRFLSENEASLPCHLYYRRADGRGKDRATDNYLYTILHDAPNPEQTAFQFWQAMRQNRAARGNAYALPKWDARYRWNRIWPLRPDLMRVFRNGNGTKMYEYDNGDAGSMLGGDKVSGRYLSHEIIHVRGMGDDLEGWSPIKCLREGIGLGVAAQTASAAFFKNGARASGVLELQGKVRSISDEAAKFNDVYAGARQTGKVIVVDQGSKFVSTTISPEDAQFLATWRASREEVWMAYGIPPHLMGDTEKSTSWGTGIEQQVIGLQKFTFRSSLEMTQQAFERVLIGADRSMFIEFDINGLLQADAKTQAEVLSVERQNGIISADDWCAIKNYNPIGGEAGSARLVNGTMIPVTVALQKTAAPTDPAPPQK